MNRSTHASGENGWNPVSVCVIYNLSDLKTLDRDNSRFLTILNTSVVVLLG